MKHRITTFLFVCMIATACRSENERLAPDTMKVMVWELLKTDEIFNRMVAKDSTLRNSKEFIRLYEEVYALHNTNKKQFDASYRYYESHPADFKILLDSVDAYASRERANANTAPPPKK